MGLLAASLIISELEVPNTVEYGKFVQASEVGKVSRQDVSYLVLERWIVGGLEIGEQCGKV